MEILGIGTGTSGWRRNPARFICALAVIGLSSCIGPGDECGGREPSKEEPAALASLAGCWSQGDMDTSGGDFSYEVYCYSTDSTLLRSRVSRYRWDSSSSEVWGEFRMHSDSPGWFNLELMSAYRSHKYRGGPFVEDTTYPLNELGRYFIRGDSLVAGKSAWCGFEAFPPIGRARPSSLELLAAYTRGPFGTRLRTYWDREQPAE